MRVVLASILAVLAAPLWSETIVATRTIRPQEVLTIADFTVDPALVKGAHTHPSEVLGLEARVTLYPGRPIMLGDLGEPAVVDRNQIVELVFQRGGLRIVTEGRALGRGGAGERIRVMNMSSRTVVFGQIAPDGVVMITN